MLLRICSKMFVSNKLIFNLPSVQRLRYVGTFDMQEMKLCASDGLLVKVVGKISGTK